jgi:glutaconate CoA-transferase subunit A
MSLTEAIALIPDNVHVAIGGCHYSRTPMASIWEIIRQKKRGLVFSKSIVATEGDLLLVAGTTKHIITSWFSPGVTWGVSRIMRHFVQSGEATYEEWSHMSLGLRYRAAAMGIPFLPTRSMLGSDVYKQLADIKEMECPFTGDKLALVPALHPDVAIIHVQKADPYGNAQITGFPFMDKDIALAADRVILTAEQIIDNHEIRRTPDRTDCYGAYEPDFNHLDTYVKLMMGKTTDGVQEYLDQYVYAPPSFDDYLALFNAKDVVRATLNARKGYGS